MVDSNVVWEDGAWYWCTKNPYEWNEPIPVEDRAIEQYDQESFDKLKDKWGIERVWELP